MVFLSQKTDTMSIGRVYKRLEKAAKGRFSKLQTVQQSIVPPNKKIGHSSIQKTYTRLARPRHSFVVGNNSLVRRVTDYRSVWSTRRSDDALEMGQTYSRRAVRDSKGTDGE